MFICSLCYKSTARKDNLIRHINSIHPQTVKLGSNHLRTAGKNFGCPFCGGEFKRNDNLNRHIHRCEIKNKSVNESKNYVEFKSFDSLDDFLVWKNELEESTYSLYRKVSFYQSKKERVTVFGCHRSGFYKRVEKNDGKKRRRTKIQGSKKLNAICPAKIRVAESKVKLDGIPLIKVRFMKIHSGHKQDREELAHFSRIKEKRRNFALKLCERVPEKRITKDSRIQDDESLSRIEWLNVTSAGDNIQISSNIDEKGKITRPFSSDALNVETFVQQYHDSVLYYKRQNEDNPYFKVEDFVLILMTPEQAEGLKKYGYDVVALDGTHGTNCYNFLLHTLLVLDDCREGFAAAFVVTNRNDSTLFTFFLSCIKEKVGILRTKVLMTDMQESFFNSWCCVMGTPESRLFCTWHVQQAWRESMSNIRDLQKRKEILKELYWLSAETNEDMFEDNFNKFMRRPSNDETLNAFLDYFMTFYYQKAKFWAYCYRVHLGININIHVDAFHKQLKYWYADREETKDLSTGLEHLRDFLAEQSIQMFIKDVNGKFSKKLRFLRRRHNAMHSKSEHIRITIEERTNDITWYVPSFTGRKKTDGTPIQYAVNMLKENMCANCKLICIECDACFHMFQCSCEDSAIKNNMCKHIHHIAFYKLRPMKQMKKDTDTRLAENEVQIQECQHIYSPSPPSIVDISEAAISLDVNEEALFKESKGITARASIPQKKVDEMQEKVSAILKSLQSLEEYHAVENLLRYMEPAILAIRSTKSSTKIFASSAEDNMV